MNLRPWLQPTRPAQPEVITDPRQRRAIGIEITIVLVLTFGLSGARSLLSIIETAMSERGVGGSAVALNNSASDLGLIDFFYQLLDACRLFGIAALAVYLIWRAGVPLARIGFPRIKARFDLPLGIGLAALIGIPGLGLYVVARALDLNVQVLPSNLDETFWRLPMLVFAAIGNAAAEEFLVVAYIITRLRQLGWSENRSLLFQPCCAVAITSTKVSAADSGTSSWASSTAAFSSGPIECGRWSSGMHSSILSPLSGTRC